MYGWWGQKNHEHVKDSHVKPIIGHIILVLYFISGSDYVSSIYGMTCDTIIQTILKNIDFISPQHDPLLFMNEGSFESINCESFIRLCLLGKIQMPDFTYCLIPLRIVQFIQKCLI